MFHMFQSAISLRSAYDKLKIETCQW